MLKPGRAWQEETFKIAKSSGCQGSFFVFSIFVFFWLSENLVLQIFQDRRLDKDELVTYRYSKVLVEVQSGVALQSTQRFY